MKEPTKEFLIKCLKIVAIAIYWVIAAVHLFVAVMWVYLANAGTIGIVETIVGVLWSLLVTFWLGGYAYERTTTF